MMPQQPDSSDVRHSTEWSDERVEQMLTWFFAQELPPSWGHRELQPALCRPSITIESPAVNRWLVPLCVAALLGSGLTLRRPPAVLTALVPAPTADVVTWEATTLPVATERISFVGTYGQFEQRNELRWTSESYFEPATGNWVEWSAPELVIDVETVAGRESDVQ